MLSSSCSAFRAAMMITLLTPGVWSLARRTVLSTAILGRDYSAAGVTRYWPTRMGVPHGSLPRSSQRCGLTTPVRRRWEYPSVAGPVRDNRCFCRRRFELMIVDLFEQVSASARVLPHRAPKTSGTQAKCRRSLSFTHGWDCSGRSIRQTLFCPSTAAICVMVRTCETDRNHHQHLVRRSQPTVTARLLGRHPHVVVGFSRPDTVHLTANTTDFRTRGEPVLSWGAPASNS
jgi:hypothetical protein